MWHSFCDVVVHLAHVIASMTKQLLTSPAISRFQVLLSFLNFQDFSVLQIDNLLPGHEIYLKLSCFFFCISIYLTVITILLITSFALSKILTHSLEK